MAADRVQQAVQSFICVSRAFASLHSRFSNGQRLVSNLWQTAFVNGTLDGPLLKELSAKCQLRRMHLSGQRPRTRPPVQSALSQGAHRNLGAGKILLVRNIGLHRLTVRAGRVKGQHRIQLRFRFSARASLTSQRPGPRLLSPRLHQVSATYP